MYPGAAGNIGGIDNMLYRPEIHGTPAENMQPIGVARGGSPYTEEKEYDKGWPPKPKPASLSFENLLGGSNLPNAINNMAGTAIANAYGNKPAGMDEATFGAIMRQYGTNPNFPGPYTTEDKTKVINWNKTP